MTPFQQGQAAFTASGWSPESNPHPFASASFASWRRGHDHAQVNAVIVRNSTRATRQIGDHLPHGWEKL